MSAACAAQERGGGFVQKRQLLAFDARVIDRAFGRVQRSDPLVRDHAAIGEALQAEQQDVARKRRGRGIGRISHTGRVQRQNLPESLAGGRKEVDELIGGRSKVAYSTVGGERCGMQ